jgi:spectinomycin phosphotransferase
MLLEPPDLPAATVLDVLREHWDPDAVSCTPLPVGAGTRHWVGSGRRQPRWFVTADDVTAADRLEELLDTYAAVRELAGRGHHVVVATLPPAGADPAAVGVVVGGVLVTVTGYLEGAPGSGEYADDNQRSLLAGALGELHAEVAPGRARPWRPGPPGRRELGQLLASVDSPWPSGPFGDPVRAAVRGQAETLERLLVRYDELAAGAIAHRADWVVTHGEPHTANVLWLPAGPVLVGWASMRLAPRERDLRTVLRGAAGAEPLSAYVAHGGTADLDGDMVELFDLESWLRDVTDAAVRFVRPHHEDADDVRLRAALLAELEPERVSQRESQPEW